MPSQSFLPLHRVVSSPQPIDRFRLRVSHGGGNENPEGDFVLYWSQSARRMRHNFALDYAITQANHRQLPVVIYESLRPDYPYASDRLHKFVLEGVARNRADAKERGLRYHFFLPRTRDEARGVLRKLAARAALIVTDEYPTFIVQEQTRRFAARPPAALYLLDGNGILPMRAFAKEQYSAKFLRDRAHRLFPEFWTHFDDVEPIRARFRGELGIPDWQGAPADGVAACDIDHSVAPVATVGGRTAGLARLDGFVRDGLEGYAEGRNKSPHHTSGLSPYLHFGHLGIQEIAEKVLLSGAPDEDIDSFLEEAVIRRELSFNLCFFREDHGSLSALPDWARKTLDKHRQDRRKPLYSAAVLEAAQTADDVWNLAQRQLVDSGTMHGYLRMLWGKKVLEWMESPEEAHAFLIEQHARYAIDGRDPNTHAGVLWCFGKHDRAWAPERPIFGMIRYMSSASTAKKVRLKEIAPAQQFLK